MNPRLSIIKRAAQTASLSLMFSVCLCSPSNAFVAGRWVGMPANGIVTGGSGGLGPLPVCRADFNHGQHPGKLWQGQCNFEWGFEDKLQSNFQVLLDDGYHWVNPFVAPGAGIFVSGSVQVPNNAVDGGDAGDAANHVRLVVCQAYVSQDRTWHPGKFYAGKCNIAWGGAPSAGGGNVSRDRKVRTPDVYGNVLILVK